MFIPKASIASQLNIKTDEKRSREREDIVPEDEKKTIGEILAFLAYMEGASVEDIAEEFGIKLSTLKYKFKKLKDYGIKGLLDQRDSNGSYQEKKITRAIGQRIQELKIKDSSMSSREIAEALNKQDGVEVSHTIVNEYLHEVGLHDYTGTPFRESLFSPWRKTG